MYIEVTPMEVRCFLDHAEDRPEWWSFEEVLAGDHDAFVEKLFGTAAVKEVKQEVRLRYGRTSKRITPDVKNLPGAERGSTASTSTERRLRREFADRGCVLAFTFAAAPWRCGS